MSTWRKRTWQKTGTHSRSTKTRNSNGSLTVSNSSKYGNEPRVTRSTKYHQNGKISENFTVTEYNNALGFKVSKLKLHSSPKARKSRAKGKSLTLGQTLILTVILVAAVLGLYIF